MICVLSFISNSIAKQIGAKNHFATSIDHISSRLLTIEYTYWKQLHPSLIYYQLQTFLFSLHFFLFNRLHCFQYWYFGIFFHSTNFTFGHFPWCCIARLYLENWLKIEYQFLKQGETNSNSFHSHAFIFNKRCANKLCLVLHGMDTTTKTQIESDFFPFFSLNRNQRTKPVKCALFCCCIQLLVQETVNNNKKMFQQRKTCI